MKSTTPFGAAALLLSSAQAHIAMQSPTPFDPVPDNSPLAAGGANFPCKKSAAGLQIKTITKATVGQPIQLSFVGSADHLGGSCQVVLSKDDVSALNPNSQFKVIYSIMGGCPGISGSENKYSVPIPTEVPSGSYTMGWTWFNKIGNREMYMNCAPMTIEGGKASDKEFASLPDMAIYNIASKNDCGTTESNDVQFPNPGKYVLTGPGFKPAPPTGSCATGGSSTPLAPGTSTGGGSAAPGGQGSSGSSGSGYTGNSGAGSGTFDDGQYHPNGKPSPSIKAIPNAAPTAMGTAVAPKPAIPLGTSAPSSPPPKPANGAPGPAGGFIGKNPYPPAAATAGTAPASAPSALAANRSCATDGAVVCSPDGTMFGLCNWGKVQFTAVAEGTKCVDGKIAGRRVRKVRSLL